MIINILNAYQSRSRLGRLEFVIGVIAVGVLFGVLTVALQKAFFSQPDRSYLIFKAAVGVLATILVLPLVIARLRDISWHPLVSLLIFVPIPFDPKWLILSAAEGGASIPMPGWVILLQPIVFFVYGFFLLTILFWKGRATAAA